MDLVYFYVKLSLQKKNPLKINWFVNNCLHYVKSSFIL